MEQIIEIAKGFIEIFKGLLTPLIAIIATYIALQQWKTNRMKLNLEKYDRRLRVYEEVIKILSIIARDDQANHDDLLQFRTSVSEADFLFGPEIPEYINLILKRAYNLRRCYVQYRDQIQDIPNTPEDTRKRLLNEIRQDHTWLIEQFEPAKEKFRKYLDISSG